MDEHTRPRRALLLLHHRRNRELLEEWLGRETELEPVASLDRGPFDVVVADLPGYGAARDRLRELRREDAGHLPFLLVVREQQATRLPAAVLLEADEVLPTPVRQGELRLRLERLLELRAGSLAAARRLVELGRSNTDLQQFAYAAAHELSNPLTIVTGVIQTISARHRERLEPEVVELLSLAEHQSARLQRLIGDLLAYSQVGSPVEPAAVDLGRLLDEVVAELSREVEGSGAEVERGTLCTVVSVETQLRLVLANLVRNALRYRRPDVTPRIRVECEEAPEHWLVSVADNGIGIAPQDAAAVFDMFRRGDANAREGHGIGLALCRRAIERQGGRIWVEPAPDGGSVFRFTLPKQG